MNPQDIISEISQPPKYKSFHEEPRVVKIIETESRLVVARDWREGGVGSCLVDMLLVLQDEKSSVHLEMVKIVNFMLWVFYHNFLKTMKVSTYSLVMIK